MPRPGKKPAGEASNSNKKCKRYFNEQWKKEFPWLEFDYELKLMFCFVCRQALVKNKHGKADNAFTVGTDNFQRHALLRHVTSGAHRHALAACREQPVWDPPTPTEEDLKLPTRREVSPAKIGILTTVYWMAKEDIPDVKLGSLLELQKFNLCQSLLTGEHHHDYYTASNVKEMQEAIVKVLHDEDRRKMADSPFIGFIVNGTIDDLENKNLVVFATTMPPYDRQTSVIYLGSFVMPDGAAVTVADQIIELMNSFSVPLSKVVWLATDGSFLMADQISDVDAKLKPACPLLKQVHCLSHKGLLGLADCLIGIDYLRKYEGIVDAVYRLYSSFEDENNSLQELQAVLKSCEIDLSGPQRIQWTSILPAVEAVNFLWPTLVLLLEGEARESPVALGLCEELKKFYFVAFTKTLLDVLPVLQKLNRFFQTEDLDLSVFRPAVTAALASLKTQKTSNGQHFQEFLRDLNEHPREDIETESRFYYKGVEMTHCSKVHWLNFGHFKETFVLHVYKNLQDRFPVGMTDIVQAFTALFSPKSYAAQALDDIGNYGNAELNLLLSHYGEVVSRERARNDFSLFKRIIVSLSHLSFSDLCTQLVSIDSEMQKLFPDFATLASIALALPLHSMPFDKIVRVKELLKQSRGRSLKDEGLSSVVKIAVDGPTINEFDFVAAIEHFETIKDKQNTM
ncbi:Zinc finger protein 862 [Acipenser ruthenus]|uniref:Zinc finger protein 862 n=1 Tax=Acipenser ruthenus TaxID=7906 RepID=A0A444ULQ5_ACIRT|nr:uncharacterized protein C17orf113 isoform X1 [Acipenser ruthenus]XP_033911177.1 uncharacterized protein C17orf113 isoform X1 [Acipenser ruthenus]XP_033911179.1 uncharacterized protein C17orf113 isoform X1 [Acipenser ruthenus]RXM36120.1 Zinc finger protein 862 [Acipenser ruthenus]